MNNQKPTTQKKEDTQNNPKMDDTHQTKKESGSDKSHSEDQKPTTNTSRKAYY